MGALDAVRVVDLSRFLAGPTAAMLLGDQGADVIKVEPLPRGDPARESGPFQGSESVYFMASNRNKRSIALDLRTPEGRGVLGKLLERADVLVENFRPGTLANLGLADEVLRQRYPRLVTCTITGFGSHGPGAALPGFDQSAQAMSGLMSVTGTRNTGPLRVGIAIADASAGVYGALGILMALFQRERTGRGGRVATSLLESLLSLMSYQVQRYLSLGEVAGRDGNDHPIMFPQGAFATADAPITLASGSQAMWRKLCEVIGRLDLADDPRFRNNQERMRHRHQLRAELERELMKQPSTTWLSKINAAGIPATPILDIGQAIEHEIVRSLSMVGSIPHTSLGEVHLLRSPLTQDGPPGEWLRRPPPLLGQHSVEVCRELGLAKAEIQSLIDAGVVLTTGAGTAAG